MREIVFDTETTGLSFNSGDRLVEIGCIELFNGFPTGRSFHRYINPERDMPEPAFKVHGLSVEFLSDIVDMTVGHYAGGKVVFFRDPDGIVLEFQQPSEPGKVT